MIELLEHYFNVLIQCVGAIYFGLGIVLLFGKVPLAAEYRVSGFFRLVTLYNYE